jgi:DNA adenine methylase
VAKPFLKWAGGKTKHIPVIRGILDDAGVERVDTYCEPFIGGGAVFFSLQDCGLFFRRAIIGDVNEELIRCYEGVRADPIGVFEGLEKFSEPWTKRRYLAIRAKQEKHLGLAAARTIYLNKAGFNGLYRVNKSGGFNVPWGKHEKAPDWNIDDYCDCADALDDHVKIMNAEFESTLGLIHGNKSLAYLDPPYVPVNTTSNFTSYTSGGFTMKDQERVAKAFDDLAKRKIKALLSQADVPWVRERFASYRIVDIQARRNINSNGEKRGTVGEVIVCANL